ncbi:MAG: DUF2235 domain-containing protein [Enhydrobacter sp.]|nr:DUF2235 domain-containing protein [Enhydrobacter sp.]
MPKNLVVCCDGTGNEVEGNLSNVLKLFRIARRTPEQRVYYSAGIGTIGTRDAWSRFKTASKEVFGLATGYGLDSDILGAYRYLCENYEDGDEIFLFGFSRGAYTVRALAGFIHMVGLLEPDQRNVANYALTGYKRAGEEKDFSLAWQFGRVLGSRPATIRFMGVWDTVASVIVPRGDRLFPTLLTLPYTRTNPSVRVFRHAMAIDERRRMFRLNRWTPRQPFVANRFAKDPPQAQDIKQVWFAGVHSDIGGGYPETESGLAKFPLTWMIDEAVAHGLKINVAMKNQLALGKPGVGGKARYVSPNFLADTHDSLTGFWKALEWLPKAVKWREWDRPSFLRYYLPRGEPRLIESGPEIPVLHHSVIDRVDRVPAYKPINLPGTWSVEP